MPIKVMKQRSDFTIILTQQNEIYVLGKFIGLDKPCERLEKCPYKLPESKVIDLKCSNTDVVILTEDHKIYSLSQNQFDGFRNTQEFVYNPRPNEETEMIKHFDVGKGYHIYTTEGGKCYAKGDNFLSLINEENKNESYVQVQFDGSVTPIQPICSTFEDTSTVILMLVRNTNNNNEIWSCGKSMASMLGQGHEIYESDIFKPMIINNSEGVSENSEISFSKAQFNDEFGFAFTKDGDLYGWGSDTQHQFGFSNFCEKLNSLTKIPVYSSFTIHDL